MLGRTTQPHHLRRQRIKLPQSGHRREKGVEHQVGRVSGVIPLDGPGCPPRGTRRRCRALPARRAPAARSRRCTSALLHRKCCRPGSSTTSSVAPADRRDVDAECSAKSVVTPRFHPGAGTDPRRKARAVRSSARTPADQRGRRPSPGDNATSRVSRRATPQTIMSLGSPMTCESRESSATAHQGTGMPKLPSVTSQIDKRFAGSASVK